MSQNKVIIVGAGAAGMTAAIFAAREGAQVVLLEHKDRVGKKILSTGNGRCNLSNRLQEPFCYRSGQPDFPWKALGAFTLPMTLEYFEDLGVLTRERDGYLYPYSGQASAVLDALRLGLARESVQVVTECEVFSITPREDVKRRFEVKTSQGSFSGETLILACGSKAAPGTGSDGSGYKLAKRLGHHIIKPLPALVQLRCPEKFFKQLAGVRADASVILYSDGRKLAEDKGEVQLTDYGISGIPVFQISRYAARGLYEKKEVFAELDFMPDFGDVEFLQMLKERKIRLDGLVMEQYFNGLFHKKLAGALLKRIGISGTMPVHDLSEENLERLCRICKHFRTYIDKTNPFEQAQICAGGVDTSEIDPDTMESKLVKGLYFAGEILDVDGICGGYNLQWAWTSGCLAGKGAANA